MAVKNTSYEKNFIVEIIKNVLQDTLINSGILH